MSSPRLLVMPVMVPSDRAAPFSQMNAPDPLVPTICPISLTATASLPSPRPRSTTVAIGGGAGVGLANDTSVGSTRLVPDVSEQAVTTNATKVANTLGSVVL